MIIIARDATNGIVLAQVLNLCGCPSLLYSNDTKTRQCEDVNADAFSSFLSQSSLRTSAVPAQPLSRSRPVVMQSQWHCGDGSQNAGSKW